MRRLFRRWYYRNLFSERNKQPGPKNMFLHEEVLDDFEPQAIVELIKSYSREYPGCCFYIVPAPP